MRRAVLEQGRWFSEASRKLQEKSLRSCQKNSPRKEYPRALRAKPTCKAHDIVAHRMRPEEMLLEKTHAHTIPVCTAPQQTPSEHHAPHPHTRHATCAPEDAHKRKILLRKRRPRPHYASRGPLGLTPQTQDLAGVVDQAHQVHPLCSDGRDNASC